MLHPSYADLINVVNSGVEPGEQPVVQSRYSIVIASAKRARQLIEETESLSGDAGKKPLSEAIQEIYDGRVKIIGDTEEDTEEQKNAAGEETDLGEEGIGESQKKENLEETQDEHYEEE